MQMYLSEYVYGYVHNTMNEVHIVTIEEINYAISAFVI